MPFLQAGPWKRRTSGVTHVLSDKPVLSSHVITYSIVQEFSGIISIIIMNKTILKPIKATITLIIVLILATRISERGIGRKEEMKSIYMLSK